MSALSHLIRRALAPTVIALAAMAAALLTAPSPASAAFGSNPLLDNIDAIARCDRTTHKMTMGAKIQLNSAVSNGALVSFNFSFYRVDGLGNRASAVYYYNGSTISTDYTRGWTNGVFMNSWKLSPLGWAYNDSAPYNLPGYITWQGATKLQVDVNVAVLDPKTNRWQFSGWVHARNVNVYSNGLYTQEYDFGPDCVVSNF